MKNQMPNAKLRLDTAIAPNSLQISEIKTTVSDISGQKNRYGQVTGNPGIFHLT